MHEADEAVYDPCLVASETIYIIERLTRLLANKPGAEITQ